MSKKNQTFSSNGRIACSGSLAAIVASLLAGSSQSRSIICMDYGDLPNIIALDDAHTNTIINIFNVSGNAIIDGDTRISEYFEK